MYPITTLDLIQIFLLLNKNRPQKLRIETNTLGKVLERYVSKFEFLDQIRCLKFSPSIYPT